MKTKTIRRIFLSLTVFIIPAISSGAWSSEQVIKDRLSANKKMVEVYFASLDMSIDDSNRAAAQIKVKEIEQLLEKLEKDIGALEKAGVEANAIQSCSGSMEEYRRRIEQAYSEITLLSFRQKTPFQIQLNTNFENTARSGGSSIGDASVFYNNLRIEAPVKNGILSFSNDMSYWSQSDSRPGSNNMRISLRKQFREGVSSLYYLGFTPYRDPDIESSYMNEYTAGVDIRTRQFGDLDIIIKDDYDDKWFKNRPGSSYRYNNLLVSVNKDYEVNRLNVKSNVRSTTGDIDYGLSAEFTHRISETFTLTYADNISRRRVYSDDSRNSNRNDFLMDACTVFGPEKRLFLSGRYLTDIRPNAPDDENIIRITSRWYDRINPKLNYNLNAGYIKRDIETPQRGYSRYNIGARGQYELNSIHSFSVNPGFVMADYESSAASYREQKINMSWDIRIMNRHRISVAAAVNGHIRKKDKDKNYLRSNSGLTWYFSPYRNLGCRASAGYEIFSPHKSSRINSRYGALTGSFSYDWKVNDIWKMEGLIRYRDRKEKDGSTGDAEDVTMMLGIDYNY